MVSNTSANQQLSPVSKRRSVEELKIKYEAVDEKSNVTSLIKLISPKEPKNSKVKQIAFMFNCQIAQMMKSNAKYQTLVSEFSPEGKQPTLPIPTPRLTKQKACAPRPETEAVSKDNQNVPKYSACFVPENVFAKLSVKRKAELYTLFVEEMTKRISKFNLLTTRCNSSEKENESTVEKQVSVKDLLNELEFNRDFPKPTAQAARAIQRMNSMRKACALRKNTQNKEFEENLQKKVTEYSNSPTRIKDNEQNQSPYSCFQNLQIENLFFSWFKEKHENINEIKDQSKQSEIDEEKQKSTIDRLLEEAIAKLESEENEQRIEIPKPMPRKKKISNKKFSESEESESGVSSLNKITSEESQPESHEYQTEKSENDFDFAKPLKPLRKKKLRKNAAVCKKEVSQVEGQQITSTDSESDGQQKEIKLKTTIPLMQASAKEEAQMPHANETEEHMLEHLIKSINSPRKIRSAYTLTINDVETPSCTPRTSLNFTKQPQTNCISSTVAQVLNFSDSFADQGFETATDSPAENYSPPPTSTLSFNFTDNNFNFSAVDQFRDQSGFLTALDTSFKNSTTQRPNAAKTKLNLSAKPHNTNMGCSTPIRSQERHSFAAKTSAKRLFSPIAKPPRNHRNSFCENELRRNSLVMQVIREDHPLDTPSATITSNIYSETEQRFFANAPTIEITNETCRQTAEKPPENELQKSHDHNPAALSEHQLRIQASLQRLNIPDWFRQYNQNQKSPDGGGTTAASTYKPGSFTRKRTQDSGRWVGLNSKTTSLSSLGSQRSDRSPLLLSPSAHSHHGGQSTQHAGQQHGGHANSAGTTASSNAFSRWSTSHLNSSQTSPSVSQRGSFSRGGPINSSFMSVNSGHSVIRNSMRQPYLGWRSQEKLSQRTAHERLASSLLSQHQRTSSTTNQTVPANNDKLQPVTPEIQTSIKEVTSAIVHYVNDQTNQQRSRSTSPNSRKCWLESSFVGARPLDSPQTPIIENTPLIAAAQAAVANTSSVLRAPLLNSSNNNINNNNNNLQYVNQNIDGGLNLSALTGNDIQLSRMNGGLNNGTSSSSAGGVNLGVERSLSNASLEDVLASLLGLPTHQTGANASDAYARSSTGGALVSESLTPAKQNQQQQVNQHHMPQKPQPLQLLQNQQEKENLLIISTEEQQRLRRRSEGDAATKQKQQQQQLQQQEFEQKSQHYIANAKTSASDSITSITNTSTTANGHAGVGTATFLPPRRVSLGDSSESNNRTASASGELQIKCRNNKCDRTATPADAKKYYKSCHNCTYLYCSRECRRAHWEKHRKACLHSRVSNLCRQVLASCKDDSDSLRHLSLLARKGFLSQGRGVVRILFRSPEAAEGFIKNGFQCMGEASYVRWPDLMPAEMGLELYSELLKLSTEYRPDSKMLVYVAVCVVSEAPGMGQAPVRWERQLVSRCAKLKLCKTVLAELEQQQQPLPQPVTVVAVPEPTTEVLILTFNPQLRSSTAQREVVLTNILDILSRRGVILRKHYPEIFQRLQTYTEGQTDKFNPVTLHPRDSHTGQNFVCIIMPVQSETEIIKLPSIADGGNRVTSIDVGSTAALAQLDDDELLTRTTTTAS